MLIKSTGETPTEVVVVDSSQFCRSREPGNALLDGGECSPHARSRSSTHRSLINSLLENGKKFRLFFFFFFFVPATSCFALFGTR